MEEMQLNDPKNKNHDTETSWPEILLSHCFELGAINRRELVRWLANLLTRIENKQSNILYNIRFNKVFSPETNADVFR